MFAEKIEEKIRITEIKQKIDGRIAELKAEIALIDADLARTEEAKGAVRQQILSDITFAVDIHANKLTKDMVQDMAWKVALKIKENVDNGLIKNPLLLPVMDGAFDFSAYVRQYLIALKCPHEHACLLVESYSGTRAGKPRILCKSGDKFANRDIIILEDIVERGETLEKVVGYALSKNANRGISVASLTDKPDKHKAEFKVPINYPTYTLRGNPFLIGCGMDYHGVLRDLDFVGVVSEATIHWLKTFKRPDGYTHEALLESIPKLNQDKQARTDELESLVDELKSLAEEQESLESKKNLAPALLLHGVFTQNHQNVSPVKVIQTTPSEWVDITSFGLAKG